jgi:betaine-aldehyde dehydrogenase
MTSTAANSQATSSRDPLDRTQIYIGGKWVASEGRGRAEVINPATEQVIAVISEGTASDVDRAVQAACAVLPAWAAIGGAQRADYLQRTSEALAVRQDELALLLAQEVGTPLEFASEVQIGLPIFNFANFAELARTFEFEGPEIGNSLILREPAGVVGCITPWNFPLHQAALKVAAALAAGCTVVLKPPVMTPLTTWALAEVFDEIGLPPGVFNLVNGRGTVVGEAIAAHAGVDMVSFTGSTAAGRRVAEVAMATIKRVALELGGKSANVILDDADLERAVPDAVAKCFINSGQTCSALTRMLVPADRLEEAEQIAKRTAEGYKTGDPTARDTVLGPLVSDAQRASVRSFIQKGLDEGALLLTGGVDTHHDIGYFVEPTVFSRVTTDMTIAREEIFGPVLSILPYLDEDDAVRIANESEYGLSGGVWSGDADRALNVAKRLRTGQVEINGGAFNPAAPFGGYKQSGIGREAGLFGFEEFLETKAIQR